MQFLFFISSIVLLAVLVYQDFKDRLISWVPIAFLFIFFSYNSIMNNTILEAGKYFMINMLILFSQYFFLTAYYTIKNRKFINIIDRHLGLGDVLMIVVLCTVFSPMNFFPFYLSCFVFAALTFGVLLKSGMIKSSAVPFAGVIALLLIVALMAKWIFPAIDFYNDYWALKYLNHHFYSHSFGEG